LKLPKVVKVNTRLHERISLAVGSHNGFQKRQKNINDGIAEIFVNKEEKNVILVLGKRDGHSPATEERAGNEKKQ
jgi:hypothetical protein